MSTTIDAFFDVMHIRPTRRTITARKPAPLIPHHHRTARSFAADRGPVFVRQRLVSNINKCIMAALCRGPVVTLARFRHRRLKGLREGFSTEGVEQTVQDPYATRRR